MAEMPPSALIASASASTAMSQTLDSSDDGSAETLFPQVRGRDRRILDHAMKSCHDLGFFSVDPAQDPQRVHDGGLSDFVLLALACLGSDPKRFLDRCHDQFSRWFRNKRVEPGAARHQNTLEDQLH
jgi:hypothetical protein